MKKILIVFVVLALGVTAYGSYALQPKAEQIALSLLKDMGFGNPQIQNLSINADGIKIDKIQLDQEGFSVIEGVKINLNWIKNITSQSIDSVSINKILYNGLAEQVNPFKMQKWFKTDHLYNLPVKTLSIEHAQYDLATKIGDIRLESKILIRHLDSEEKSVQAVFWGKQHQISFEVPVSGIIKPDGRFLFESTFNDGKMNIGVLRISRLNGWASSEGGPNSTPEFSMQLTAGSGEIKSLPLQDIALAFSQNSSKRHTVLRSGVTNVPSAKFNIDSLKSEDEAEHNAAITLEIGNKKDLDTFMGFVAETETNTKSNFLENTQGPYLLSFALLPDRRFTGGPLPFAMSLSANENTLLSGNILIYPSSLDVRGAIAGDTNAIEDLRMLLDIEDENMPESSIPLDLNLKDKISF